MQNIAASQGKTGKLQQFGAGLSGAAQVYAHRTGNKMKADLQDLALYNSKGRGGAGGGSGSGQGANRFVSNDELGYMNEITKDQRPEHAMDYASHTNANGVKTTAAEYWKQQKLEGEDYINRKHADKSGSDNIRDITDTSSASFSSLPPPGLPSPGLPEPQKKLPPPDEYEF